MLSISSLGHLRYHIPTLTWGWPYGSCQKCFPVTPLPANITENWGKKKVTPLPKQISMAFEVGLGGLAYVLEPRQSPMPAPTSTSVLGFK